MLRPPEGTGELVGARDDRARRTLCMAQVPRRKAVHGIGFTPVHGAAADVNPISIEHSVGKVEVVVDSLLISCFS